MKVKSIQSLPKILFAATLIVCLYSCAMDTTTNQELPVITMQNTPGPTLLPSATPWVNAQGYPLMLDEKKHLMVRIPATTFMMGIDSMQAQELCKLETNCDPQKLEGKMPLREVSLPNDYWMDVYEVTNIQYQACEAAGICKPVTYKGSQWLTDYYGNPEYDDYPVIGTDWDGASTFCQEWRNGALPTEAQWEFAARGDDGRLWPWGNSPPNGDLSNYIPYEFMGDNIGDTMQVGNLPDGISPFGLYDLSGNVFEWVQNCDDVSVEGEIKYRCVARGGSYGYGPVEASVVDYQFIDPKRPWADVGFRCVKDVMP